MRGLLLMLLALSACDQTTSVTLLFDRGNTDPTQHPFPTDAYHGDVVLDGFTDAQLRLLPFLRQLRFTAQLGWSPITALRIPLTPVSGEPDKWLDVATVPDAVRVYRMEDAHPTRVAIGAVTYREHSGALLVFPKGLWAPGTYAVAVIDGRLRTRDGSAVQRSRDADQVVESGDTRTDAVFAAVAGADEDIDGREDTLAFWTFTVVDATGQLRLLASYVEGKAPVDLDGQDETLDITPYLPVAGREIAVGSLGPLAAGDAAIQALFDQYGVGALPHDAIAQVIGGGIAGPVFVSDPQPSLEALFTNGTFLGRDPLLPFSPGNPLSLSHLTPSRVVSYAMVIPKVHATPMPVIVAFHGVGRSKEDFLAFANTACATGHALVAIDLYQHGDRQAAIDVPEGDFSDKLDPVLAAQGIAFPDPFIDPTFLARTRDKLRQSVVDNLVLVRLLEAANGADPRIDFDGDQVPDDWGPIRVVGQSLGAMVATAVVAVSPAIDRAVLNVAGGDLAQIVNDSPQIGKDLDLLIYAVANADGIGLLAGSPRFMVPDGPEREVFTRVAETILAAVDPQVYAGAMVSGAAGNAQPRLLIQQAYGDTVVPNNANIRYALAAASGADPGDVTQVEPVLFETGLPVVGTLGGASVTQFAGAHGFLLDFVDQAVTAAAQTQAAQFLAAP